MEVMLAHKYFCDLINGVEYLHSKGIVHRDLKPENLLLNDADQIKIADFGLATLFQYKGNERLLTSPCGTAPYVAPEVLNKSQYKAQPTDIWSCGIVLVAMLAGELPWDKPVLDCEDFISWVKYNNYQKTPWCKIENTALSLLRNILMFDPSQRFTIRQIKSSAWYVKTYKQPAYESFNQNNGTCFSQPSYVFRPDSHMTTAIPTQNTKMGIFNELEFTDSQQNCECHSSAVSMHQSPPPPATPQLPAPRAALGNLNINSFSQPVYIDVTSMFVGATQNPQSQFTQSQSPLLKLVKRMTRMFIHLNVEACTEELKKLFTRFMYDYKVCVMNDRQRQITVTTSDRRQTLLTFKVNVIDLNAQNEVLVDFRLSKGDGLEFKKIFMNVKTNLSAFVCKRYVFTNNTNGCCDGRK